MPGEKRHAAGLLGEKEALGANWKSAQCVTSLYDSYIQLQRENEALREDARGLQQQSELLAAQSKQNQLREPEGVILQELQQEIRLLRSEKLRLEEAHRLELQKLETRAASSETQHQQLVAKYQERFEFDPLESKRAALALKTMQNTLQNAMLEKEELGIRYGELKEQYREFHAGQMQIVTDLKQRVQQSEHQRVRLGQQRVIKTLAQWSTNKMQKAWTKWIDLTKEQKLREEIDKVMLNFELKVDDRVAKIRDNQAAMLAMKLLQQTARKTFLAWKDLARRNTERRRKGVCFSEERTRRRAQRIMVFWRQECRKTKDHRDGVAKIERLLICRRRQSGMRRWSVQNFRLALDEKSRSFNALNGTMELQARTIIDLERFLDEERKTRREVQTRHEEEKAAYTAKIETHRVAEQAVRQKLGRFFTKQSDRQLLKDALSEWKITANYLRGVMQRSNLVRAKLRLLKLRRSVYDWHCTAHQNHKKHVQTQQILGRMRQLGVLRCFNSWKERVKEEKNRKMALLHAVNRIRNRGVGRCFAQWTSFRVQRISLRSALELITKYAMKQQVFFLYTSWKERVTELKIESQVRQQQLIQQAWEDRLVQAKKDLNFQRECFTRWHKLVLHRQRQDVVVRRCVARLKNGYLARMFGSWRDFVECREKQRELICRWVTRCYVGIQQRAWSQWQRQLVLKEQQILMLRLQEERDAEMKQLEREFDEYRTTHKTLMEEAELVQTAQECKLQETTARLLEETKRAQRLAGAVETLCSTRERGTTLVQCFKAWQKVIHRSVRNQRTAQAFQATLDARQTRGILSDWKRFTTQQKQLRAVFITVKSCFSRLWQIQCFDAWKEARQRSRAVNVFSALFARNSEMFTCREVFTGWRKLAQKNNLLRRTLEQIWLGSVHAKMRQQFAHWVALTKAEAENEQLEKRNAALTAIRAKVWWKQSVSTMRFCLSEWKEAVEVRKKQRLAERKLMLFQRTRLVTVCFAAWAEFVQVQGQECERNQRFARWLRKLLRRKQARVVALWKMLLIRNQLQELHELKMLKSSQQEELQLQKDEIAVLAQTAAETKRKLEDTMVVHDESTTKAQYLTECGLVAKYFNVLKFKVLVRRYQYRAVHFCQKNTRRQHLAELFSNWYSFSQNCRAVKLIAAQKLKLCLDTLSRTVLRQWQTVAFQQRIVKQKQQKLCQRTRGRIIANCFVQWHRSIHVERNVSTAVIHLETITRRLNLKSALSWWYQKCLQDRDRDLREREKHKKIMQFLMGRQEAGLVRTFHAWNELTQTRQATRLQAQQRYSSKCLVLLMKSWKGWRSTVETTKFQRKAVQSIQIMASRYYYRVALSRWRRYRFMSHIALLQSGNEQLVNQVEDSSRRLQSTTMSVDQLSTELMELQDKLNEAESKSSVVSLEVTSQHTKRSKQLSCLHALSKIMQKRTVSSELSEAFALWKTQLFDLRRKHEALASVARIRQRRKRLYAFWLWKVKTLRWRQLDSLKKLWERSDLLSIVQRWRKYTATQSKLRLFLTKRCLLSYTSQCLPTSIAFNLWKTKSTEFTALQQVATLHATLRDEQDSSSTHLRRLALSKWCWIAYHHRLRQMRAFLSRCYANSTKNNSIQHQRAIEEMQMKSEAALTKAKEQSEARAREEMGALSAAEEQLTAGASFQALQTLIRRLFQPTTVQGLFVSVASTFAQILHGSAAVLFLFDPSSNELWTQREENQLIQVPASLGIAGSTLSSGSTLIITDVSADPRFHPMVDQFVVSGLRQDDAASALMMATSRPNVQAAKPTVGMVSSALVSSDGAVYGILQVAFPTPSPSAIDRRLLITQTQLYSKICCFYVEQIVFEMLRNCRDRVRARAPDKFIKLFKQNKNWRKYYAAIERKAVELESKLRDVIDERVQLIESKSQLQKRYQHTKDKLESSESNTKDVGKLVLGWKKKLAKWQEILDEKDRAIAGKTSEVEKVEKAFERYRREQRSKDLQSVLNSNSPTRRQSSSISSQLEDSSEFLGKSQALSDRGRLSILKADQTRLKSQLVRAEADNLLLVKAISMVRTQHGELPRTIQAEVTRVATRVSRRAPPEA